MKRTKKCSVCEQNKDVELFNYKNKAKQVLNSACKACRAASQRKYYKKNRDVRVAANKAYRESNREQTLLSRAKHRAKRDGLPFNITLDDIIIPDVCPVLGITLDSESSDRYHHPSLDKLVPELGYVKGNVHVISFRANWVKNNSTVSELQSVLEYMNLHLNK